MGYLIADLYQAYRDCRQGKSAGRQAQIYEAHLIDRLFNTQALLQSKMWKPAKMRVFIAENGGKKREIHAPDFADRVVHHYLIARIQPFFESIFIFDSAANRLGKGTLFGVKRIQKMMRRGLSKNPHQPLYYLQLDIENFFYTIDKTILFALLSKRLFKMHQQGKLSLTAYHNDCWLIEQIIFQNHQHKDRSLLSLSKNQNNIKKGLPKHKILANNLPSKGLPIGCLTSQFFSNVYLNELDQFVKHQLKIPYYVRYVDDFILLSHSKTQLQAYQQQISDFLAQQLQLKLKAGEKLQRVQQGLNFLGYIIRPHYCLVRRRVVGNLKQRLLYFYQTLFDQTAQGIWLHHKKEQLSQLNATMASYLGHFSHANSRALVRKIYNQQAWLSYFFYQQNHQLRTKSQLKQKTFKQQQAFMKQHYKLPYLFIQKGRYYQYFNPTGILSKEKPLQMLAGMLAFLRKKGISYVWFAETSHQHHAAKKRQLSQLFIATGDFLCRK